MKTVGYIPKKEKPKDGAKETEKNGGGKTETPGNDDKPKDGGK